MSHITKIDLEVTNLDALEKALATIDPALELKRGQTTFRWFGQYMGDSRVPAGMDPANYGKCAHAIGFKEGDPRHGTAYEIGVAEIPGFDRRSQDNRRIGGGSGARRGRVRPAANRPPSGLCRACPAPYRRISAFHH